MDFALQHGDCIKMLGRIPDSSVRCCVTSPPYWGLRDYGHADQIGLERTPDAYVGRLAAVFREVRRVLTDDGTLWLNLGDSYMGGGRGGGADNCKQRTNVGSLDAAPNQKCEGWKTKDLVGIPWRVAFALQADGWWLRSDIIWSKPNPMPESVTDRPTKAHEYVFLLAKSERYYYDAEAIAEPAIYAGKTVRTNGDDGYESDRLDLRTREGFRRGVTVGETRNRRSVWTISSQPYAEAHFAVMPSALVEPCILAGSARGDLVLDPFAGAGTVGLVALRHGRRFLGIELNAAYVEMARRRIEEDAPLFQRQMNHREVSAGLDSLRYPHNPDGAPE